MMPKDDPTDLSVKRQFDFDSTVVESGKEKGYKRIKLHVDIPADNLASETDKSFSSLSPNSLFDEPLQSAIPPVLCLPALRTPPHIPGLFFDPSVRLPEEIADELSKFCLDRYFSRSHDDEMGSRINQVMLFGRAKNVHDSKDTDNASGDTKFNSDSNPTPASGLSPPLVALLNTLSQLLSPPVLPQEIHNLLFDSSSMSSRPDHSHLPTQAKQAQARQAILNLYAPGEGISSHVDLLRRFGDGIIGVSLCGGCVMRFERVREGDVDDDHESSIYDVYLPPNSIIVLSGDARYKWTHGIEQRIGDWVRPHNYDNFSVTEEKAEQAEWIPRGTRLSITFRWLLPGADVVGDD